MSHRTVSPMSTDSHRREFFWGQVDDALMSEGDQLLLTATRVLATAFHNGFLKNTPEEFENITMKCACIADRLREGVAKTLQPTGSQNAFNPVIRQLTHEQNAYELMCVMLEYETLAKRDDSVLGQLLAENSDFKMLSILLEWSERCGHRFLSGFSKHVFDAQHFKDVFCLRREATNLLRSDMRFENDKELGITADSTACQEDAPYVDRFYKTLFSLVRCGRLDEADQLCDQVGESTWGGLLTSRMVNRNPDYTPTDIKRANLMWQNRRKHFKQYLTNVWDQFETAKVPRAETCLFATLIGRTHPLIDFASTIEDKIWCVSNAAVEYMLDRRMGLSVNDATSTEELPTTIEQLEEMIKLKKDPSPYMHVYFYVLKNQISECVTFMANWLEQQGDRVADHIVRFMANLLIIWKQQSVPHNITFADQILKAFVVKLGKINMPTLMPFYLSFYSDSKAMLQQLMSAMDGINDETEKAEFLENAHESGISISELLLNYAFSKIDDLRKKEKDEITQAEYNNTINAWKWILLSGDETITEALHSTNALIRVLLKCDQEDLAVLVLEIVLSAGDGIPLGDRVEHRGIHGPAIKQAIEEYRNHAMYLASVKLWLDWNVERNRVLQSDAAIKFQDAAQDATIRMGITINRLTEMRRKDCELLRESVRLESIQQEVVRVSFDFLQEKGWRDVQSVEVEHELLAKEQQIRPDELAELRAMYYASTAILLCSAFELISEVNGSIELAKLLIDESLNMHADIKKETLRSLLKKLQRLAGMALTTE
ncbi:unnamed protein product, partial [Mesorhabditis belari]|uniref:Nuclear pore complex protein n=1 Tax=Mesorhabditis belari TaxID=2138241 RepID=A0AAF3F411_9BILA